MNLNGVLRLETSRMSGLPARNEVTMSSCSSCRWKRGVGAAEAEERDMVNFRLRRGVVLVEVGWEWRVPL